MKLAFSSVVAVLYLACGTLGASDKFASVGNSPFKPVKFEKHEGGTTHFSGSAEVSGRFVISWWNEEEDLIRIKLLPDEKSKALLPYLATGLPASAQGLEVAELEFEGSKSNVRKLLSPEKSKAFLSKRVREATGFANVRIKNYMSGVDCDNRWYMAKLLDVRQARNQMLAAKSNEHFRC